VLLNKKADRTCSLSPWSCCAVLLQVTSLNKSILLRFLDT